MKNIQQILTQARAIKITNPDGSLSFKIVEITPGSVYSSLGIQNEDIITHINGKPISNLNEVMGLFGGIQNMSKLNISVNRSGSQQDLDYQFQ